MSTSLQPALDPVLVKQIQDNFIAYHRMFTGLPGITYCENANVVWIASPDAPGSQVLSSQFTEDNADRQIDEVLRQVGQHANSIDWMIYPGCQPADLGRRMVARGEAGGPNGEWMLYGNTGDIPGTWMLLDMDDLVLDVQVYDSFHVQRVVDQAMLEEWVDINARGFGSSDYSAFRAAYSRHGFGPDAQMTHLIGYLEDEAVTSSSLLVAGGSASVYNVSTPVELRRQGLGSAITHAALAHARELGYQTSWIWSSKLGRGVYTRLGFVTVDLGIREYQWKKRD